MKHFLLVFFSITLLLVSSGNAFSQNGCIEIESILVNSCAPGNGAQEGLNEMLRFKVGPNPVSTGAMSVQWANTNLPFQGLRQDVGTAAKTSQFNATIQSCGWILEPPLGGIIPSNSQVLLISSYDVNTATSFFQFLSDTIYILYANESTNAGHFLNYVPNPNPDEQTTIISFGPAGTCEDQVTYFRSQLLTTAGNIGDQDGAGVNFSVDGTATYFNNGCIAPVNTISADFNVPPICNATQTINLNSYLSGTPGGTWTGQGVSNGILDPAGLVGSVDITYTVGVGVCQQINTQTIPVLGNISPEWNPPAEFCFFSGLIDLNQFVVGTPGGTWSGPGISGGAFNPSGIFGNASITYTVGQNGCNLTSTQQVPVILVNGFFSAPSSICETSAPIDLSIWSAGLDPGEFSGPGVSNNIFNPAGLSGQVEITFVAVNGTCSLSTSNYINITSGPDVSWLAPEFVCAADGVVDLNSLVSGSTGGTWSGTGVTGSTFDPTGIVGNIDVTYSLNAIGCAASSTQTIVTGDLPELVITGAGAYCIGQNPGPLSTSSVQNAVINWYDDAFQSNLIFTGPLFTPPADVNATYYAFQSFGQCSSNLSSVDVVYYENPASPTTESIVNRCENQSNPLLNATSTFPVQWFSDAALTNFLFEGNNYQPLNSVSSLYVAASNQGCLGEPVAISITVLPLETASIISSATSLCNGNTISLTANSSSQGTWSTGATSNQALLISEAGTYSLSVVGECNTATDQIVINDYSVNSDFTVSTSQGDAPLVVTFQAANASSLCDFTIDQSIVDPNNTGQITFLQAGEFALTHTCENQGCISETVRIINVSNGNFVLEIPNSFTPNGDGFNDLFKPKVATGILEYRAVMFDRWGQEVIQWEGSSTAWDGTFNGNPSPDGVYFYVIRGKDVQNNDFERHGSVTLIRN